MPPVVGQACLVFKVAAILGRNEESPGAARADNSHGLMRLTFQEGLMVARSVLAYFIRRFSASSTTTWRQLETELNEHVLASRNIL